MPYDSETAREAGKKSSRKGVPNQVTSEIREAYTQFLKLNMKRFQEWIDEIAKDNPAKAMDLVLGMSDFVLPKLNRTEVKSEQDVTVNVEKPIKWTDED